MFVQGVVPMLLQVEHRIHSAFSNAIDVFSWVILWRPIYELIFEWNPHLKEIALLDKLATAEVILIDKEKHSDIKEEKKSFHEVPSEQSVATVKSMAQFGQSA